MRKFKVLSLSIGAIATAALVSCDPRKSENTRVSEDDHVILDARQVFAKCSPSVFKLNILTVDGEVISGSGFSANLAQNTVILTNRHVVENAAEISIEGNKSEIDVSRDVRIDMKLDLAVIAIKESDDLKPLQIRETPLEIGETVFAIGYPHGLNKAITQGMLSTEEDAEAVFSASISSGNSGGPLLDSCGDVIGVITSSVMEMNGKISQNFNIAIKASRIPALDLFTPPKTHLFAAWKAATRAESDLYPLMKATAINNSFVQLLNIFTAFNINNIATTESEIEVDDMFILAKKATMDPEDRERCLAMFYELYSTEIRPVVSNDIENLEKALEIVRGLKIEIGKLNQKSRFSMSTAADSRTNRMFDTGYDPELSPRFLEFSINRFEANLEAKINRYRILLEIMSRSQNDKTKLAAYLFRRELQRLDWDRSPDQLLKSIAFGYNDDEDTKNPLLSLSIAKPAPSEIDFTCFRNLAAPTLTNDPSKMATEDLLNMMKNLDLPHPPLDMDYKKLKKSDKSHAAFGDFLSTLVGMYDLISIELMEKGRLDEAEKAIKINDENRPHSKYYMRMAELESMRGNYGFAESLYEKNFSELANRFDPYTMDFNTSSEALRIRLAFGGGVGDMFESYPADLAKRMRGWDEYSKTIVPTPSQSFEDIFSESNFGSYSEFQKMVICECYRDIVDPKYSSSIISYDDVTKDPLRRFPSLKKFLTGLYGMNPESMEPSKKMIECIKILYPN
jgi:hypothetical protein